MADRGLVWNGIQFFTCSEDATLRYISSNCISSTLNVYMSSMSAEMQNLGWSSFGNNNIYAYSPNNIISVGGVSWTRGASIVLSAGQYLEVVLEENAGYKLSGKWKIDEEYGWMVDDVINYGVSFNSGGVAYNYMESYHWNDDAYLYYGTSPNSALTAVAHYDYDVGNNSWVDFDKNSIVDFGSTEQEVGNIFYQWFTSTFSQYQEPADPGPDWSNSFIKTASGNKAVEKVWLKQNGQLVTVWEPPAPPAPTISLSGSMLTVTNLSTIEESGYTGGFKLYANDSFITSLGYITTPYDLTLYITEGGTYSVYLTTAGDNTESEPSNTVTYVVPEEPTGYNVTVVNNTADCKFEQSVPNPIVPNSQVEFTLTCEAYEHKSEYLSKTINEDITVTVTQDGDYNNGTGTATFSTGESISLSWSCFIEGTLITLADRTTKPVEQITYEDDILVWNFDEGKFDSANPCWVAKEFTAPCYWEITLADGTILGLVGANGKAHRMYDYSRGRFIYPQDFEEGEEAFKEDGTTPAIVSCEKITKEVKYYNFECARHLNCFANGTMCGSRFSNVYPIEGMKYIKDGRELAKREDYAEIPDILFDGLRLAEQPNMDRGAADQVDYFNTMKEHVIHNYVEHEQHYAGPKDYKTWLFKAGKEVK